jgi:hypothetical protein
MDECGWIPVSRVGGAWSGQAKASTPWRLQPWALVLGEGGLLELDDCGLLLFEDV